jgi:hypothetical protein
MLLLVRGKIAIIPWVRMFAKNQGDCPMRLDMVRVLFSKTIHFDAGEQIRALLRQIPSNYRYAFVFGLVFSFLANGLQFFHIVFTEDGLLYWYQSGLSGYSYWQSGRWMMDLYRRLQEGFAFPLLTGAVCSVSLSAAACLNGAIWRTRRLLPLFLMAGVYTSFPTFANAYSFQFMAPAWPLSCLFSVAAVYFVIQRTKSGFVFGVGSLVVSLAFYQSFIGVTAGLLLITMMFDLFDKNDDKHFAKRLSQAFFSALRYLASGLIACGLYLVSVRLFEMAHPRVGMAAYQGMERMGQVPLSKLAELIVRAYNGFAGVFTGDFFLSPLYLRIAICSMPVILVLCLVKMAFDLDCGPIPRLSRLFLTSIFLGLLPLATCIISLLAPESTLTIFHISGVIAVLSAAVYVGCERLHGLPRNIVFILAAVMLLGFVNRSNAMGLKSHLYTETAFHTAHRVLARLETLPEFQCGKTPPVVFVGNLPNSNLRAAEKPPFTEKTRGVHGAPPGFGRPEAGMQWMRFTNMELSNLYAMMNIDLPYSTQHFARAELLARDMPVWPAAGSVAAFDGLVVVNFGRDLFVEVECAKPGLLRAKAHVREEPQQWLYTWKVVKGSLVIHQSPCGKSEYFEFACKSSGQYRVECLAQRQDKAINWISRPLSITVSR